MGQWALRNRLEMLSKSSGLSVPFCPPLAAPSERRAAQQLGSGWRAGKRLAGGDVDECDVTRVRSAHRRNRRPRGRSVKHQRRGLPDAFGASAGLTHRGSVGLTPDEVILLAQGTQTAPSRGSSSSPESVRSEHGPWPNTSAQMIPGLVVCNAANRQKRGPRVGTVVDTAGGVSE